jgi:ATP-dependent DNA helicase RecG
MDILDYNERVKLSISLGESQWREFKSAYAGPDDNKVNRHADDIKIDIGRTLVAFANADGGELLIGVEDDGTVTGVPHSDVVIQKLLEASTSQIHSETPLANPIKRVITFEGKKIIFFAVQKGLDYVYLTSDGRCLKRKDRDSSPVTVEKLTSQRFEDISREFERQIAAGVSIADLDRDLIVSVAGQITPGTSIEKCLQYLNLAEFGLDGLKIKRAGVLLFAKDINKWHPGSYVRIFCINGREKRSGNNDFNVTQDEIIMGNILTLIDEAWKRLTIALIRQTRLSEHAIFENTYLYPEAACREALVNAIVHRNYAIQGRGIEIDIFSDRMEIKSPGMLLSTIQLGEIKKRVGVHESRNPVLARVLREIGYVREMGEGIRRIYDVLRQNSLAEPAFENENSGFNVIFYHKSMYDPKVKLWLSNFENYNLTESQTSVISLGYNDASFSTQDIIARLGIIDTDQVRQILTPLRNLGIIDRVLSDNETFFESKKLGIPKREVKVWKVRAPNANEIETQMSDNSVIEEIVQEIEEVKDFEKVDYFIANLPYNISHKDLYQVLNEIEEVNTLTIPSGNSFGSLNKGFAFVSFKTVKGENNILEKLNSVSIQGRLLKFRLQRSL